MIEFAEVARFTSGRKADQQALILVATGIPCHVVAQDGALLLMVAPADLEEARRQLRLYALENRPRRWRVPPGRDASGRTLLGGLDAALACCAALVFLFAADTRHAFRLDWVELGAADAGRIMHGQWWRALTSLGLHADLEHLLGNLAFGALFGLFLSQALGAGLAWLTTLLAGGLGNLLDAAFRAPSHGSIGASTAIFGSLGILAAYQWRRVVPMRLGLHRWGPLAAGILLLAFLGSGDERTDVGAHVAGFLIGCLFGLVLARAGRRVPRGRLAQWLYGGAALALFAGAWLLAIAARG